MVKNTIKLIFLLLGLSLVSYGQDFANYASMQVQTITQANLLKNNDASLPMYTSGKDEVSLTVFYDYNCHASRQLLKLLNEQYNHNPNNKVKIVFRPMDYGFNSKEVLQAIIFVKNLNPSKFEQINQEIIKIDSPITLAHIQNIAGKIGVNFQDVLKEINSPNIQTEIDKNKQDFEALPYPDGLQPQYKSAIPVIILSRAEKGDKLIYFLGSNQNSLETAISNIKV